MAEILLPNKKQLDDVVRTGYNLEPIYGAKWDKGENPLLTPINDSIGMVAEIGVDGEMVRNDYDKVPIFGEFEEVIDASGNVFIRIPKCYIRKVDNTNFLSWQVSKKRYPGFYLPWCFWDFEKNKELDCVYIGKYKASLGVGNKLESKPNTYPLINTTIVSMRNYAKNNNTELLKGYQQLDIHVVDLLQTLMLIELGTLNSQSKMAGYTSGQYTATHKALISEENTNRIVIANNFGALYEVGQAISIGTTQGGNQIFYGRTIINIQADNPSVGQTSITFDGEPVNIAIDNMVYNTGYKNGFSLSVFPSIGSVKNNISGKHPFVYRGIESVFGDVWQFVDGININDNQVWVCKDSDKYSSNLFTVPYEKLSYINHNGDGYPKFMGFDVNLPFANFPTSVGGATNKYYSDYYYQAAEQRIALFGGDWRSGSYAGLFCWSLSNASSLANIAIGGRLLKKAL